jgi:hypothetical protein
MLPIHNQMSQKMNMSSFIKDSKVDLDASCDENGPNLSSNPAPCFLVPIIIKCSKLVMMDAQTFFYFSTSTCFVDKELVQQYKLILVEKSTPIPVEIIDGRSLYQNQSPMKPSH